MANLRNVKQYVVFTDESYITSERYGSIAAFSMPLHVLRDTIQDTRRILVESNVTEFKWHRIKNAKHRFCGEKLYRFVCENVYTKAYRLDVIIWDNQDSRNTVKGRDDYANFERMFYHLMKSLIIRRGIGSEWHIFPDERMGIDWATIRDCLTNIGRSREVLAGLLPIGRFLGQFHDVKELTPVSSRYEPCCQIADLFAGLAVFSINHYDKYESWCYQQDSQLCLFGSPPIVEISNSERERFCILKGFDNYCKTKRMGVGLKGNRCLCTHDPTNPINFWRYIPQHPLDKAPRIASRVDSRYHIF